MVSGGDEVPRHAPASSSAWQTLDEEADAEPTGAARRVRTEGPRAGTTGDLEQLCRDEWISLLNLDLGNVVVRLLGCVDLGDSQDGKVSSSDQAHVLQN